MEKYSREAWGEATTLARPWEEILKRAGLPDDLVPYSLRHSSVVRGLKAGLPLSLVSKLHDTSAAMVEAAYARFLAGALEDLARGALVPLMPAPVERLRSVVERGRWPSASP